MYAHLKYLRLVLTIVGIVIIAHPNLFSQIKLEVEDVACEGQANGKITASLISGISGDFEYSKDGSLFQPSNVFDQLSPGSYNITIRDKKTMCSYSKSATIKGGTGLSIDVNGGGRFTFCDREGPPSITLTASASGGDGNYTFEGWSGNKKEIKSTVKNQTLVVRDGNNCKGETDWSVEIVRVVCSRDPNDIIGPDGFGDSKFVSVNDRLPYKIRFENDPEFASAPAQKVVVEHIPDKDLNLFSLYLSNFGFANLIFEVPGKSTFYKKRLDVRDSLGIFVDVTAGIDVTENKVFWIFESVDANTGLEPSDPQQGLLPVNDTLTKKGEGFVDFTIVPKSSSGTGDSIIAEAAIVFDVNETINTPKIYNIIDAYPPVSTLEPLPTISDNLAIPIYWEGMDDDGGSGIKDYTLFVSENNSDYYPYESGITDSSLVFVGSPGGSYRFFVIATDNVGNVEKKNTAETFTSINPDAQLSIITFDKNSYCVGDSIGIQWASAGIEKINILFSSDNGETYTVVEENVNAIEGSYKWVLPQDFTACDGCIVEIVDQTEGSLIKDSLGVSIFGIPPIEVNDDVSICSGDYIQLEVNEFDKVLWTPSLGLSSNIVQNPIASPDQTTTYDVRGLDKNGCENSSSVTVRVSPASIVEIEEIACIAENSGISIDTLVNQFNCDSIVVTNRILDSEPPVIVCPPTIDITIPRTGNYTLAAIDLDPNISDNCGVDQIIFSQSEFTCVDVGIKDIIMEVMDYAGNTSSCAVSLNIIPSNICSITMSNATGADILTPCSCLSGGEFEEEITIFSLTGETWQVQSTDLLNPDTYQPYEPGTLFTENPSGSGMYRLKGIHKSEIGYNLTAESQDYEDFSIALNNTCYYPSPNLEVLDSIFCIEQESFALNANVNGVEGSGAFRIDGSLVDFFNPLIIGAGTHTLEYEFDAGIATPNDIDDPGCLVKLAEVIEIKDSDHPICKGDGPFFTFLYSGPDTIFADSDCQGVLDLGIENTSILANFTPEQNIASFEMDANLTGYNRFDLVPVGAVIPLSYIATDNYANKDTFVVNVVVVDNIDPSAQCRDITIKLSEDGLASISVDSINVNSFDACGIDTIVLDRTSFTNEDIGDVQVEMTVTDIYGNSSGCIATVTVKDYSTSTNELPEFLDNFQAYPNPTSDIITLELNLNGSVNLYIDLLDENGRFLQRFSNGENASLQYKKVLDLKVYHPGYYVLKIGDENGKYFFHNIVKAM